MTMVCIIFPDYNHTWIQTNLVDSGLVSVDGSSVKTLADYASLSSRVAQATPASTSSDAYTPSNSPAACPVLSSEWESNGDTLPPTPDSSLCTCMYSSLSCVPEPGLNTTAYGDIFGYICFNDPKSCTGIGANTTTGVYGAYSMCNATQQLGYVLDQYYKGQGSASGACDFQGQAVVTKAAGTTGGCSASLASASSANSVAATATDAGGSSQTSKNAAPTPMRQVLNIGDLAIGLYVLVAMGVGAGMVML